MAESILTSSGLTDRGFARTRSGFGSATHTCACPKAPPQTQPREQPASQPAAGTRRQAFDMCASSPSKISRASGGSVGTLTTVSVTSRVLLARWKKAASTYGPIPSGVDSTAWGKERHE